MSAADGLDPRETIRGWARALAFDGCGFTDARLPEQVRSRLKAFVSDGFHGTMQWMADTLDRRLSPECIWPEARSAIVLTMNYGPETDPLEDLKNTDQGVISVYARNRDYHDVIKGRLKTLAGKIAAKLDCEVKVFVDTAPLMEKPLAAKAGLGWQGKHTNLVSRKHGSWLFLGVILTDAEFHPDEPESDHCGNCRACLDICPTNAFPEPYRLDARRCISYLTIEHAGPIPHPFREAMGNRIYGCDDCLAVCPWNKFARVASEAKLVARNDLKTPELAFLASLDDAAFRKFFSGSPIKRIGRNRFLRNVLIAIGNSGIREHEVIIEPHLEDPDPVVRGAAIWALSRLAFGWTVKTLASTHMSYEQDESVLAEWRIALGYETAPAE